MVVGIEDFSFDLAELVLFKIGESRYSRDDGEIFEKPTQTTDVRYVT